MLKLLYFFNLVDLIGCAQEDLALPDGVSDVAGLLAWLGKRDEKYRATLADGSKLQVTINKKFVDTWTTIQEGDEIAFFPNSR
jgi:molybdopterin synthase sulfur carrier subunit